MVVDGPLLDVLTAFDNKALAGELPTELRPYFCFISIYLPEGWVLYGVHTPFSHNLS